MDTTTCLMRYPWRTLAALGEVYDVPAHHHLSREDVARNLSEAVHRGLPGTLGGLSDDARAALRALTQTEGLAIPRPDFIARFGALYRYRPWDDEAPPGPWPEPPSPAAALVHFGLAYPLDLGTVEHPIPAVLLPHDLQEPIAVCLDLPPKLPDPSPGPLPPGPDVDLQDDMFAFLSFLNRRDYAVTHGRWLPPRALKALNDFLRPPDDLGAGRSELQADRVPFLHYLAERAGLVGLIGDHLKPTLLAEEWMAVPADQRVRALWEVWCEHSKANQALWARYRLPALKEDRDPLHRFQALLDGLAACPPGPLGRADDLLDALARWEPALLRPQATYAAWDALGREEQTAFAADARELAIELLNGPLLWFGILKQTGLETDEGKGGTAKALHLTPLGAALLGREDGAWPADPASAPLRVQPFLERGEGEAIDLRVPDALPLLDRFALEAIVPPDPEAVGRYRLTPPRFQRALQRGHTAEGVVSFLERASDTPLPVSTLGALYRWAETFGAVTIREAVLLQTRDAARMRQLTGQRRLRETLGPTLNARTVEVEADLLEALLRRLERRDVIPRLDISDPRPDALSPGDRDAERAAIVAALQVYAHLADALGHPTRPAYALIRRWREALSLPLRDAADRRAKDLIDALHRADPLVLEDRLPQPTGPLLDVLRAAIEAGETVEIDYYTAGRAHRTTRQIDPLRLEWRGDVVYLIAYCYLREDQRVFRVDRIQRVGE